MIQNEEECIQTLMKLGLTFLEAKIYLTLAKFQEADVRTIFQASNVARQDIYRVMPSLQNLGLAQEIVGKPTRYRATSMKIGYDLLLKSKKQDFFELQQKTLDLIEKYDGQSFAPFFQTEKPQFVISLSTKIVLSMFNEMVSSAQSSLDILGAWEGIRFVLFQNAGELKRAVSRNVRIRLITEIAKGDKSAMKTFQGFWSSPFFEVRYFQPLATSIIVSDKSKAGLRLSIPPDNRAEFLWSTHPMFSEALRGYFESVWEKASGVVPLYEEFLDVG
ncbi:MAG: hypothetical protein NWE98_06350 [Candidatus Bathyarchaeota archaeon]|nr:hypothetical protein [Candidatus Bathyarchaeota archaeon]